MLLEPADALERYADEWRAIAEQRGNAFVSPEWFASWQRHLASGSRARVAIVRDRAGELLGLMPFALRGRGAARTVRIAGADHGDWMHPVAAAEDEVTVAAAAIAEIERAEPGWGALVLDNVDTDAAWTRSAPADRRGRAMRRRRRRASVLPYASLAGLSFEQYLQRRSPSFRRQLLRFGRRLERQASIELRQTTGPEELEKDLETMFRLHFARWATRGVSSLDSPGVRAFHHDFARAALERGWLRLLTLEADGEPVASFYGWRLGDRFAFYQGGFDPAWSRFSVGLVINGRAIERAIAEGAGEYDMLLGSESYKLRFCESMREVETLVLTKPLHPAGAAVGIELAARRAFCAMPEGFRDRARRRLRSTARLIAERRKRL